MFFKQIENKNEECFALCLNYILNHISNELMMVDKAQCFEGQDWSPRQNNVCCFISKVKAFGLCI